MATPRIARGMSRRGSCASSPKVAAASNPAKERKPNTTPRNTAERPVPPGTVNTEKSRVLPLGTVPVASLTRMTTLTIRIRATVVASMTTSTLVPSRMLEAASAHTPAKATAPTAYGAQPGWSVQIIRAEDPGRRGRHHSVEGVGPHERPPGDDARPWSQRCADEAVDAAGVVEALGKPDKGPSDKEHTYRRQRERERDGPPDGARGPLRVDVGGHGGRHEGERDADGLPQVQLSPQVRTFCAASAPYFGSHADPLAL